jgi:hypothetical protein
MRNWPNKSMSGARIWDAASGQELITLKGHGAMLNSAEFSPDGDLARAFEMSVAQADNVADRLRREADHVAEKAKLLADRKETIERHQDLTTKEEEAKRRYSLAQQDWREQWRAIGIGRALSGSSSARSSSGSERAGLLRAAHG